MSNYQLRFESQGPLGEQGPVIYVVRCAVYRDGHPAGHVAGTSMPGGAELERWKWGLPLALRQVVSDCVRAGKPIDDGHRYAVDPDLATSHGAALTDDPLWSPGAIVGADFQD